MLYEVIPLERDSAFDTSNVGQEKTVSFNKMCMLDEKFIRLCNGYIDEAVIGIGTQIETTDPQIALKPVLYKGLGMTTSVNGDTFYEILFYQHPTGLLPYRVSYRSQAFPHGKEELVNYASLELIYQDIYGKHHGTVIDPRLEVLTSYVTDDVYGTGQGLSDLVTETLVQHPLFGKWARHSISGNTVRADLESIMRGVQYSASTGRLADSTNRFADAILPLEIARSLALFLARLSPNPQTWLMNPSPIGASCGSMKMVPQCASLDINPKELQNVADIISSTVTTDFSIVIRCDVGWFSTETYVESCVDRYAVCLHQPNQLKVDVATIEQLCTFSLTRYLKHPRVDVHKPLFIRIVKTFNEEIMISYFQTPRDVLHQVYFDVALLSICSMGVSVLNTFT